MDDKELIKKICAYVKEYNERPFSIEDFGKDKIDKYWYFLHAHNILSVHNYFGLKITTGSESQKMLITKIEVNESLLNELYGILLG